ncbi:hypothetical protein AX27061_1915 [Achromobacter xylosoxidans NBRC 15126 = ATCC 27061]|nr:hypothetical protein AX27061_1915 [Achromobacter xylosoxidans NBRC 15126 = ATCC 27061]CCH07631.1 hypothetical protein NH44784_036841 [Achromobacter xylosoxidans NH44784-1996]
MIHFDHWDLSPPGAPVPPRRGAADIGALSLLEPCVLAQADFTRCAMWPGLEGHTQTPCQQQASLAAASSV